MSSMLEYFTSDREITIGVDEAGRGALAGPVVSCAFLINKHIDDEFSSIINDSKKLNSKTRLKIYDYLSKNHSFCVSLKTNDEIDNSNILICTMQSMSEAINKLIELKSCQKNKITCIIDGSVKPAINKEINTITVVKGDQKYIEIACASIIAKVTRDKIILGLEKKYNLYGFSKNLCYGTADHLRAISKHGLSDLHRKSFLKKIVNLDQQLTLL